MSDYRCRHCYREIRFMRGGGWRHVGEPESVECYADDWQSRVATPELDDRLVCVDDRHGSPCTLPCQACLDEGCDPARFEPTNYPAELMV